MGGGFKSGAFDEQFCECFRLLEGLMKNRCRHQVRAGSGKGGLSLNETGQIGTDDESDRAAIRQINSPGGARRSIAPIRIATRQRERDRQCGDQTLRNQFLQSSGW